MLEKRTIHSSIWDKQWIWLLKEIRKAWKVDSDSRHCYLTTLGQATFCKLSDVVSVLLASRIKYLAVGRGVTINTVNLTILREKAVSMFWRYIRINIILRLLLPKSKGAYVLGVYAQPQVPQHSMVFFHIVGPHSGGGTRDPGLLSPEPVLLQTGSSTTNL